MDRKKALTLAGAAGISVIAVGTAMAANLGLLRTADTSPGDVGTLTAEDASFLVPDPTVASEVVTPSTIVVDEYIVEDGSSGSAGVPATGLSPVAGAAATDDGDGDDDGGDGTTPTGTYDEDSADDGDEGEHEYEDEDEYEDEEHEEEDEEEDEEHEYEGAEDDD